MSLIKNLSDTSFQTVLDNDKPMLVKFGAPWCGPCKMLDPILEIISKEWEGQLDVAKVDIDENPQLVNKYDIASIPAMLLFKNGELVSTSVGAKPKAGVEEIFKPHL